MSSTRVSAPSSSIKQSSTSEATSEKRAKFTPVPSNVAPSGYGLPGHMSTLCPCSLPIVSNTTLSLPPRAHPEPLGNNATGIIYTHGSQVLAATSAQKKEYAALAAQVIAARASRFGSAAVVIA